MSQHTPGPWKICAYCYDRDEASPTGRRVRLTSCRDDAEGFLILSTNGTITELPSHRREADARLIAAAPELLASLENALEMCLALNAAQPAYYDNVAVKRACTIADARRAIAKAKGVQS